jgi:hypothetical protein
MMIGDIYHFVDTSSAVVYLVGLRTLNGAERPQCLKSLRSKLLADGTSCLMSIQTTDKQHTAVIAGKRQPAAAEFCESDV